MKIAMEKWSAEKLIASGYSGPVLVPVCDNMEGVCDEVEVSIKNTKTRTDAQRKAIEVYCSILADTLNSGGLDMKLVLEQQLDVPWSQDSVKNILWRQVQKAAINKESTAKLSPKEVSEVYRILSRHLAEKFNVNVSFPNRWRF